MQVPYQPVSLGTTDRSAEVGGFRFTESRHEAGMVLERHAHAHAGFTLVLEGSFAELFTGRAYRLTPGGLLCKPAGEPHANRYGSTGARSLLVEVLPERAAQVGKHVDALERVWTVAGGTVSARARELHRELARMDGATPLALEGLALEGLALEVLAAGARRALERARAVPSWLAAARECLHDRFAEPLRIGELAVAAGVHPVHLARAFRRHFGASPGEYLRRVRLEWAREQLLRGDRTPAQVALEAGFADQSHFTRAFRAHYGVTPARLRGPGGGGAP